MLSDEQLHDCECELRDRLHACEMMLDRWRDLAASVEASLIDTERLLAATKANLAAFMRRSDVRDRLRRNFGLTLIVGGKNGPDDDVV